METNDERGARERLSGWVARVDERYFAPIDRVLAGADARLFASTPERYRETSAALWTLALCFYVVGDTGLTTVALELGGFEVNPVARALLGWLGYPGLVLQKLVVVWLLTLIWRFYPTVGGLSRDPWRLIVPGLAAVRGLQLIAVHLQTIAVVG